MSPLIRRLASFVLAVLPSACASAPVRTPASTLPMDAQAVGRGLSFRGPPRAPETEVTGFKLAQAQDPADLERWAQSRGGPALVADVRAGGELGALALSALAYSHLGPTVLDELCDVLPRTRGHARVFLLRRLIQIAESGWEHGEQLSSFGGRRCKLVLKAETGAPKAVGLGPELEAGLLLSLQPPAAPAL